MSTSSGSPHGAFMGALDVRIDQALASAGSRALAYIVDASIIVLVQLCLFLVAYLAGAIAFDGDFGPTLAIVIVAAFSVEWLYFIFWEQVLAGQSPGKRVFGLRVVRDDGGGPGFVNSVLRNLMRPIDMLPGSYCAAIICMFTTGRHQRLGDLVAGTVVVAERMGPREAEPRVFPEGFSDSDVRLVEAWVARERHLHEPARTLVRDKLLAWLDRDHPGFVSRVGAPDVDAALDRALGVAIDPGESA